MREKVLAAELAERTGITYTPEQAAMIDAADKAAERRWHAEMAEKANRAAKTAHVKIFEDGRWRVVKHTPRMAKQDAVAIIAKLPQEDILRVLQMLGVSV